MTLTLLVDLDDTLIGNSMEVFIPRYLQEMDRHLENLLPPDVLIPSMLDATQAMFSNERLDRTLKETFNAFFFPQVGLPESALDPAIDQFYQSVFPSLVELTEFRPDALDFISQAFDRGYQIGIATNPVFPRTAIIQRLEWAGFPARKSDFALISSYETFHFAKPDPAFFAEFLAQIGWPEGPVVMVGNDPDHDIRGSRLMEIPSFWIEAEETDYPENLPKPNGKGTLKDFYPWLDSLDTNTLIPMFTNSTAMIAVLRGGPAGLSSALSGIDEEVWCQALRRNEWNLIEIACHLRDVEQEVNQPRLKKILTEENAFISGIDSDIWAEERRYAQQDGIKAFQDFLEARMETLAILEELDETGWKKEIRHAIFGPTNLSEIIHFMTRHEILHGRQAFEIIESLLSI